MLDFDGMLVDVGEFGRYQKFLFAFQAPICIYLAFVGFGQLFMEIYPLNYWCDELLSNTSQHTDASASCLEDCKKLGLERHDIFYHTIVTEGHWGCNADLYTTVAQSIFFVGAIIGGFLIGWIADTFGRVHALVTANLIAAIGGILSTFTTDFYWFSFFRFITGMGYDNCFVMMYILVLEFCGPSYRTVVANLSIAIFYTIGTVLLPILAVYLADWRLFGRVIAAPMFLVVIACFVVPESSRWLISKGKIKRATDILRLFAKVNRKKVDEQIFLEFEEDAQKMYDEMSKEGPDPSLKEAFKTPRLRRTFILLVLIWSCINVVYDGHNRNILNLEHGEWNLFWLFGIAAATEFPADIFMIMTLDRFGRRWMSFLTMFLSGICSFIAAEVPEDAWTTSLVMAMLSRFWINVAFNIGLQYASELLPTVIRGQGVNVIHQMGYVAALVSPVIANIGHSQPVVSLLLLGALAVLGGILSLFLSETLGEDLPNNLEEAEAFGKNQSFWNCPICAKAKPVKEEPTVLEPEEGPGAEGDKVPEEELANKEEKDLDSAESPANLDILESPANLDILESPANLDILESPANLDILESPANLDILESPTNLGTLERPKSDILKWRNSLRSPIRGEEYRSSITNTNAMDGSNSILSWLFS